VPFAGAPPRAFGFHLRVSASFGSHGGPNSARQRGERPRAQSRHHDRDEEPVFRRPPAGLWMIRACYNCINDDTLSIVAY
jgi:hypothetical protein